MITEKEFIQMIKLRPVTAVSYIPTEHLELEIEYRQKVLKQK